MEIRGRSHRRGEKIVVRVLCGAALVVGVAFVEHRDEAGDAVPKAPAPGMRIYRDPDTGAIGAPAPGVAVDEAARVSERARSSEAEPLIAEPVDAPAGGIKVNLHGRFRAAVTRHAVGSKPGPHQCVELGTAAHE